MPRENKKAAHGGKRRGAGRKPLVPAERRIYLALRLEPVLAHWIKRSANKGKLTKTQFVEAILQTEMARQLKKKNPPPE